MIIKIRLFVGVAILIISSCSFNSDELALREEFKVPNSVDMVYFEIYPKELGWFGREGLKIDAVFQFNAQEFNQFVRDARESFLLK